MPHNANIVNILNAATFVFRYDLHVQYWAKNYKKKILIHFKFYFVMINLCGNNAFSIFIPPCWYYYYLLYCFWWRLWTLFVNEFQWQMSSNYTFTCIVSLLTGSHAFAGLKQDLQVGEDTYQYFNLTALNDQRYGRSTTQFHKRLIIITWMK